MYLLIYALKYGYEEELFRPDTIGTMNRIFLFASTIFALMLLVVPSYISGLLVAGRGTLIGFLVAVIGFSIRFFFHSVKWSAPSLDLTMISMWIEQMLVPMTVGAVSGARLQRRCLGQAGETRQHHVSQLSAETGYFETALREL